MKKTITAISFLLLCFAVASAQQQSELAVRYLKEDPSRAGNNIHCYEFFQIKDTPAPKGFKPFYVSHYGRHGSRSGFGDSHYTSLIDKLTQARNEGILTEGGDSLLTAAIAIKSIHNGMDGRLSQKGVRQHAMIADRLYHRYPSVFKGKKKIRVISSTVPRALISMNGFTNSLKADNPKLEIYPDAGEKFAEYINKSGPSSITDGYKKPYNEYQKTHRFDTTYTLSVLFTDPVRAKEITGKAVAFMDDVYSAAAIASNFDIEDNLFRFLPFDFIYSRWSLSNHRLYMGHCASLEYGDARMKVAENLANDIVAKADEVIESGEYAADLRFGHDFPLLGLVSYLGLEGVGERCSFDDVDTHWLGFFYIPMASNLQMVFYRNKAGEVIVKFLYQEKETLLRKLEPWQGPYYKWEDVKANLAGYLR